MTELADQDPVTMGHLIDMIHALRGALGQPQVALPDPPKVVFERAVADVEALRDELAAMKRAERDRRYRDEGYGGHL